MRALITGANGQLGQSLAAVAASSEHDLILATRNDLDITDKADLERALNRYQPDLVINCAAYTAVDGAETEPDLVFTINADGAGNVARAAANVGCPIVQISTDYVFDGAKKTPYTEEDATNPLNVYGASKRAGEGQVAEANPQHIILRTSWLYGPYGSNFMKTMLRLAETRDEIQVVSDQTGCPTSTLDLAAAILKIARHLETGHNEQVWGLYHCAARQSKTWAQFAREIVNSSERTHLNETLIKDVTSEGFGSKAERPPYSVLNCSKLQQNFNLSL